MDAKKGAKIALEYFQVVCEKAGPIGFTVEHANKKDSAWIIICSMWDYLGARKRSSYEVQVDANNKNILKVSKVGEQ